MTFTLDTSEAVFIPKPTPNTMMPGRVEWSDLDAFTQGAGDSMGRELYERLLREGWTTEDAAKAVAFRNWAPETLARIIADCAEYRRLTECPDTTEAGRGFWADRQARKPSVVRTQGRTDGIKLDVRSWPPLTPYLGNDGRVMAEAKHTPAAEPYARHRADMRAKHSKMTPYRAGIADGAAYAEIFWAWSDAARASRDYSNRPDQPACPYSNRHSARAWKEGFDLSAKRPRPAIAKVEGRS